MNRISSYASPLDLYRQVSARQQGAPARPDAAAARPAALSAAEEQSIRGQFPQSPALSMKLYGPQARPHTVNPGALGTRLDLQG